MAVSAELPRLQPCSSVPVPPPRQGVAAPGWRPPLTRLRARNFRARIFGRASFRRFLAAIDKTVKYEEVYLKAYDGVSHARTSLGRYLDFYNRRRPHSSLDRLTPDQVYFNLPQPSRLAA